MRKALALMAGILLSCNCLAAGIYDGVPDKFFEHFKKKEYQEAIKESMSTSTWKDDDQSLPGVVKQMEDFGNYKFHELLSEKKMGRRGVNLVYLVGMDHRPILLSLSLYKPDDKWVAYGINFNDKPESQVLENAKKQF